MNNIYLLLVVFWIKSVCGLVFKKETVEEEHNTEEE